MQITILEKKKRVPIEKEGKKEFQQGRLKAIKNIYIQMKVQIANLEIKSLKQLINLPRISLSILISRHENSK